MPRGRGNEGTGAGAKVSRGLIAPGRQTNQPGKALRKEQIIMFVLANPQMSYDEIGEVFGMSKANVSAIMKSDDAKEIIQIARNRLREKLLEGVEGQLDLAAQAAVKVLKRTLDADISPVHKAKANQDRTAVAVLRGRGILKTEATTPNSGYQLSPEQMGRLERALNKADQAAQIDPFEGQTVIEAEVVDDDDIEEEDDRATA